MDGPYRLTTRKTAKDRIQGHWYYYYSKGELELRRCCTNLSMRNMDKERERGNLKYLKRKDTEKYKKTQKDYLIKTKCERAIKKKEYDNKNKERNSQYQKQHRKIPAIKAQRKAYAESYKPRRNKLNKEKYNSDKEYRLIVNLRTCLANALKAQGASKNARTIEYSCCCVAFLYEYLEKQFADGMSWENHGKWHIDHRRARSTFNLNNDDEIYMCQHYTNLQPMWAPENLAKGNDYDPDTFEYEWKGRVIGWQLNV